MVGDEAPGAAVALVRAAAPSRPTCRAARWLPRPGRGDGRAPRDASRCAILVRAFPWPSATAPNRRRRRSAGALALQPRTPSSKSRRRRARTRVVVARRRRAGCERSRVTQLLTRRHRFRYIVRRTSARSATRRAAAPRAAPSSVLLAHDDCAASRDFVDPARRRAITNAPTENALVVLSTAPLTEADARARGLTRDDDPTRYASLVQRRACRGARVP